VHSTATEGENSAQCFVLEPYSTDAS